MTYQDLPELTDEDKIRAWETGRLGYLMRNTQKVLKRDWGESKKISRKFYIESTRRLGKSSFLLMLMTEECIKRNGVKCGFFAPVKEALLDYIKPIIETTYGECPDGFRPRFDQQHFLLDFDNGSSIVFRGSNNQQHRTRRGQEFHLAGIDEARDVSNLDDLVDSVVFPALFDSDGHMIISSTPADTRSHPLYAIRQRAEVGRWLTRITMQEAHELDPEIYPQERIDEWKRETLQGIDGDDVWKREYECEWVVNKSRAAVAEWKPGYVQESARDPYYQFYHHYIGIDWGYRDYTAVVFGTWNFRKARLEVDGELTFVGTEVRSDKISDQIRRTKDKLWGANATVYRMVSDSADPILINELNKEPGMNFTPVHKLNSLEAMLQEFRILVNAGKIVCSPKATMTAHGLANGIWDEKRDKLDQDVLAHHFDHLMALVYLTRQLDRTTNPIPADFMVDGVRVIDLNFDRVRPGDSARQLEGAFKGAQRYRNGY